MVFKSVGSLDYTSSKINTVGKFQSMEIDIVTCSIFLFVTPERFRKMWFQQDETACHTVNETIVLLQDKFSDRVIFHHGNANWPSKLWSLKRLNFFPLSYLKSTSTIYKRSMSLNSTSLVSSKMMLKDFQPNQPMATLVRIIASLLYFDFTIKH